MKRVKVWVVSEFSGPGQTRSAKAVVPAATRALDQSRRGGASLVGKFTGGRCFLGVRDTCGDWWLGEGRSWAVALKNFRRSL